MSTSYHPQSDGQTENVNRVVQDILRAFVSDSRRDWDRHLTAAEIAINSSRHASTGYTPFFLNHNQEVRLPFGIALKEAVARSEGASGGCSDGGDGSQRRGGQDAHGAGAGRSRSRRPTGTGGRKRTQWVSR